jgi:serum/glucocorticoid-regulated kinase 2
MMYEMLTGRLPFYSENLNEMYTNIVKNPFMPDKKVELSDECLDFLNQLFQKDPSMRIGMKSIE